MKNEKLRVPKLRFKEFSGEWEEKSLENIAKFLKGKGISKSDINEDGSLECIRYGELYTHYKEKITEIYSRTNLKKDELVLSEYGDIIIPASGETQIDIATASCVLKSGVALSGDLNIIKTKEDGLFLSYYLNNARKLDIAKLSQGISVVHLYSSQLKLLKLNLPQKQEQEKIASFLSSIDKKINQLSKKDELLQNYKKAMMQKIFSQKLRFKKEDGSDYPEWEEKQVSEFLKLSNNIKPNKIDRDNILTVKLHQKGIEKSKNTESLSLGANYYIRRKGQFVYGKQNFFNGAFGIVPSEMDGFLSSSDVPALDFILEIINPLFFNYYFGRKNFYNKLEVYASGTGSKRIHEKIFLGLNVKFPIKEEQTKIANFLSSLDTKISQNKKNLEETQKFKKALLQKMFV